MKRFLPLILVLILMPIAMCGSITLLKIGAIQWDNPTQWYQPYHFDRYGDFWEIEFTSMVEADNGDILLAGTTEHLEGTSLVYGSIHVGILSGIKPIPCSGIRLLET